MKNSFQKIGIISRFRKAGVKDSLKTLINFLESRKLTIVLEADTAKVIPNKLPTVTREDLGKNVDLIISVGGDGNLLSASRIAAPFDTPILGINRGRFGFLTDIRPDEIAERVDEVLQGQFSEERRFMLQAKIKHDQHETKNLALNDVIIAAHDTAHMMELEIQVNNDFMCAQESDGVIIATPTGSTAYALSGGGPILHPSLNAIVMVPMFPHTLSNRPIVLDGDSKIKITIPKHTHRRAKVTCDGQDSIPIKIGTTIEVVKNDKPLRLIHPLSYRYFDTLRGKLYWGQRRVSSEW